VRALRLDAWVGRLDEKGRAQVRHDVHGVGTDAFEAGDDVREGGLVVNAVRRFVREERVDLDVGRAGAGAVDVFLREGSDDLSVDATGVAEATHTFALRRRSPAE
jgi:hypothetical protein